MVCVLLMCFSRLYPMLHYVQSSMGKLFYAECVATSQVAFTMECMPVKAAR